MLLLIMKESIYQILKSVKLLKMKSDRIMDIFGIIKILTAQIYCNIVSTTHQKTVCFC